jgi:phosphoglycerol transferase
MSLSLALFIIGIFFSFNRKRKNVSAFFFSFILVVYIVITLIYIASNYFTGEGINDAVIFHLRYGLGGAGFKEYYSIIFISFFFFILNFVIAYFYFKFLKRYDKPKAKYLKVFMSKFFILLAFLYHPTIVVIYQFLNHGEVVTTSSVHVAKKSFSDYYAKPKINKRVDTPYNLVYIYVESLERTYFDETLFPKLLPELKALEDKGVSFTNIQQVHDTGWTIAGMLASQCGLPLVTTSSGNSMSGVKSFYSGATCIGDVLKDEDYYLSMMQGSSVKFAGIKTFYKTHKFDDIEGKEKLLLKISDKNYLNPWGLYDDTLFDLVYDKFEILSSKKQPFALYLATIDTHHPKGHEAKECKKYYYQDGSNPMLNAVHCTDHLLSDFIEKIRNSKYAKKTVIVVSSDHLAMQNTAIDILKKGKREDFFMILSPQEELQGKKNDKLGSMLDVAPTVLHSLGFSVDKMALGRDLFTQKSLLETIANFNEYLKSWYSDISKFWNFGKIKEAIEIDIDKQKVYVGDSSYNIPVLFKINRDNSVIPYFDFDSPKKLYDYLQDFDSNNTFFWIDDCSKIEIFQKNKVQTGMCYALGKLGSSIYTQQVRGKELVDMETIKRVHSLKISDNIYLSNVSLLKKLSKNLKEPLYHKIYRFIKRKILIIKVKLKKVYFEILEKFYKPSNLEQDRIIQTNMAIFNQDINKSFRLIAHAGGKIDGYAYTDSLEALNSSYKKGFKLFELDIIKTKDDVYVASHDWKTWKKQTDFTGTIPPTLKEFKQYKIYHILTPMDINDINQWFKKHPDAILVTDKVNTPKEFSKQFIDKNRLMMELFSWEAVKEARQVEILKAMPTWSLVKREKDIIKKLNRLGIDTITVGRKVIYTDRKLVEKLKANNIKIYAYHINYEKGKDEIYTLCNELNYFYGLYADKWDFTRPLGCEQYLKKSKEKR